MLLQGNATHPITTAQAWMPFLALLLASAFLGFLVERLVVKALKTFAKRGHPRLEDLIVRAVRPSLSIALFVGGLWFGITYLDIVLPAAIAHWTVELSVTLGVLLLAVILSRLIAGILRYQAKKDANLQPLATIGSRLISIVLYVVAFVVILDRYNQEITPLLTTLGLAGLAIALALQDTLANFFAGLWIQTGKPLRPGHFVRVEENQVEGYVVDVGWRTTKIRTFFNNIVAIPNAKLAQSTITDYYLPSTRMLITVPIHTAYQEDPARVERVVVEEALAAAKDTPGLLTEPAPYVRFLPGFGEYALQFTLYLNVREFSDHFLAQHEVRKRILARFRKEGIKIPMPIRHQIQVRPEEPPVEANTSSGE